MAGVVLLAETFRGRARIRATGYLVTAFCTGYIIAGLLNLVLRPLGWCWFNYAPELFPKRVRGVVVGCSVQVGRFLAAAFALFSGQIISALDGAYDVACSAVSLFYLVGIVATFLMPKSNGEIPRLALDSDERSSEKEVCIH
jgi:hypothetical protein